MTSQWGGARVRRDTRWQHQTDPASRARQLEGAFDEKLIAVDVRSALDAVHASLAYEIGKALRLQLSARANICGTAVSTQHVPWRIADDRVKSWNGERVASFITKDFRKCQRPMEEAVSRCQCGRVIEKTLRQA